VIKEVVFLPVVAASTWFKIFAQSAPPMIDPAIGTLLGNLGIMGVLVWYLWYDTTKSRPKMLDKFSEEQEKIRQTFATEQQALRLTFAAEQSALRDANAKETRELRAMLIETMKGFRTAVHDVKDTANQAILKTEQTAARAEQAKGN
jgi:hypothetical protein